MFIGDFDPTLNNDYFILSCEFRSFSFVILHIRDCFSCVFSVLVNMLYEWNIVEHFKNACPFKCRWPLQISFHKTFPMRPWYIGVSSAGPEALATVCYVSMQLEFLPYQNLELGWIKCPTGVNKSRLMIVCTWPILSALLDWWTS